MFGIASELLGTKLIPYSGKLSREKPFVNFIILWLVAKVFSAKFGGMASVGVPKLIGAIRESFLHENCIYHQFVKVFSLESFPLYGIWCTCILSIILAI